MSGMVLWASIVISAVLSVLFSLPVHASDSSVWRANQDFTTETSTVVRPSPNCTEVRAEVVQPSGGTQTETVCEQRGTNLTVGPYTDATNHKYYAIKIGFDQKYRKLADVSGYDTKIYLRPEDDALIVQFPGAQKSSQASLSIFRIDDGGIVPALSQGQGTIEYKFDFTKRTRLMELHKPDGSSYYSIHKGYALSDNREYLLMWMDDRSVVVTNTITGEMRLIAAELLSGVIDAAISDDGRYVALGTVGYLYDTDTCGETYDYAAHVRLEQRVRLSTACPTTYIYNTIYKIRNIQPMGANFYFTDENTALAFDYPRYNPKNHVLIKTEAYDPTRLDYLALGDSYSSGEGDVGIKDGASYYIPVTDEMGGCHISTRSYPFLLRDTWGVGPNKMQSVACSGAQIIPDYMHELVGYQGQNSRLVNLSSNRRRELQQRAVEAFIPGYVPQLEFVKKYQPKTLTFTGGGNDVGFADILTYCASDILETISYRYSCEYVEGGLLHDIMYDSIHTQKQRIKDLVTAIHQASPFTKVILIGYPSFIAGSDHLCAFNSSTLDGKERDMINAAVAEMNSMLKSAAAETQSVFIDISNSLNGGRICEGSAYVTGLWFDRYYSKISQSNAFHPNAEGHKKIAERITTKYRALQSLINYVAVPETPAYTFTLRSKITNDTITPADKHSVAVQVNRGVFGSNSEVNLSIFSKKSSLGVFRAAKDGSLEINVSLAMIKPGRHVLVAEGMSSSGDKIRLYQFISIFANLNDVDGDGIDNKIDTCQFVDHWYDEKIGADECEVHTGVHSIGDDDLDKPSITRVMPRNILTASRFLNLRDTNSTLQLNKDAVDIKSSEVLGESTSSFSRAFPDRLQRPSVWLMAFLAIMILLAVAMYVQYHKKDR